MLVRPLGGPGGFRTRFDDDSYYRGLDVGERRIGRVGPRTRSTVIISPLVRVFCGRASMMPAARNW